MSHPMTHAEKLKTVLDALLDAIHLAAKSKSRTRRMAYNEIAWDTDVVYAKVALQDIMVPPVPDDPMMCLAAFEGWAYRHLHHEGKPEDAIGEFGGQVLKDWIIHFATPEVRAVMLLWALGHAEGAEVHYDDNSIMVFHGALKYGISQGKVVSRFLEGRDFPIASPEDLLNAETLTRSFSTRFIAMYREAYRDSAGAVTALLAVSRAFPEMDLWRLSQRHDGGRTPPAIKMRKWERILVQHYDPIAVLFRDMVPGWLTRLAFTKVFGRLQTRRTDMSAQERQKYITKMHTHFHKNKDKK